MVYITGDIHSEIYPRFSNKSFLEQKTLTKDDYAIILGDFGIPWDKSKEDQYKLKELESRPFTTLFIDGNHENYDLLEQFPVKEWHGGSVHQVSEHVLHLMRGQVFDIDGKTFFTFGGARSHDIQDGILDGMGPNWKKQAKHMVRQGKSCFRVSHVSWWDRETASEEEMQTGLANLEAHGFSVDYVLTHTLPARIAKAISVEDPVATYLDTVLEKTAFRKWYFGHMHTDAEISRDMQAMYETIARI